MVCKECGKEPATLNGPVLLPSQLGVRVSPRVRADGTWCKTCEAKAARRRYFQDREGRFKTERFLAEEAGLLDAFSKAASDQRMQQLRKEEK